MGRTPKIVKRKFPGPAGLLLPEKGDQISSQTVLCSQSVTNNFNESTWMEMLEDLSQNNHKYLLNKYNIGWVITQSNPTSQKIPFLGVKIKRLELIGKKPNFILSDPTGEIGGIISEELYERFSEFLTINSVLILKGCSLLSMGKKRYLIITGNNLLKIYNLFNNSVTKESDELQIITINKFNYEDFDEIIESPPPKKFKSIQISSKQDSSLTILSQSSQNDINEVQDALTDIDFDDF